MEMTLSITGALILICVFYVVFRFFTKKTIHMKLDKGGVEIGNTLSPNYERSDIKEFLKECQKSEISVELAKDFIVGIYNTLNFIKEPPAPKLSDNRYEEPWEIDDDIGDLLNYVLSKYQVPLVRWNQDEVLDLKTMEDILVYMSKRISSQVKANQQRHPVQ